jgi:hypothetical protein
MPALGNAYMAALHPGYVAISAYAYMVCLFEQETKWLKYGDIAESVPWVGLLSEGAVLHSARALVQREGRGPWRPSFPLL